MLERTDAITNKVLEPIMIVIVYPTVYDLGYLTANFYTHHSKNIK